ncbi:MAG: prephenate dehydrogenase dimerization domain-containing protein, partial [Anaerolineae bacterium]|nr:prephenate dehydrogenase dimerization domain-containing protein [Anaerolineae bacterium]
NLYHDQTFILCSSARTNPAAAALAEALVAAAGAQPLWLGPLQHDRLVALVSHLPYFAAAALMAEAAAAARTGNHVWQVSAGGFRDTTRLAGSDPLMLRDISETNRDEILAALRAYARRLQEIITLLERGDREALLDWLAARQREHTQLRAAKQRS